jgi:DNA-binding GntR family transcriptional regulator
VPVAGGPAASLVGGLLESEIPAEQLRTIRGRIESGAVLLLAEDLDEASAGQLAEILRQHHVEQITSGPSA